MRKYRCKVKTIKYQEVIVYVNNKEEAKREASSFCEDGYGITVACQTEILDIEHMPKEK